MTNTDHALKLVPDSDQPGIESETATAAPESEVTDTPRGRRTLPSRRALAGGAGVLALVAAVVIAAVLAWDLRNQNAVENARQQALAAAQQYAVILTSVDAAKLDENFTAVLDGATGEFKDMYSQSSAQLKQVLIDNKAKADGTVMAAGVKSATEDKVEVMLFLDQSVTNSLNPEPRLDRSRLIITMEKVNGRWLAGNVELP